VLSLGKLAHGQQQYYLDTVAKGAEEYYTGAKEAPGEWQGAAATRLGLAGEVDADALSAVLGHRHPATGEPLSNGRSHPQVAGFDATFSAPKSVSLLFALGRPEVSNEVRNAHDAAVRDALTVLEDDASVGRRGQGGAVSASGDGFVAAAFRHRTSRAAEPQLHTHVVIANLVHSVDDDRWTALDARPLYRWARPVGHLYEAQLRWELTHRLGVAWRPVRNGIADVAGIPQAAINAFSTRRRQIAEHLDAHGESSARAAQIAAYATRTAKDSEAALETLVDGWRARAAAHGLDDHALACVLNRQAAAGPPTPGSEEAEALFHRLASPEGLTAHRSTFGRGAVLEAICDTLPNGGQAADIVELADTFLASPHVVALSRDADDRRPRRWTTPEMLATEDRLLRIAEATRSSHVATTRHEDLVSALDARPTLTPEQVRMVRGVCTSGHGVDVVEGVAGAGKTFALAAAHDAWTASGYRVRGACLAARAAQRLEEGSGIPSTTLDRALRSLDRDPLTPRDILTVDEAGMVGTRKLLLLIEHTTRARAKVVLIGDPRQLPEIEAGGAFAGLLTRHGGARLVDKRRQQEPWERAALAELRDGDTDRAVDTYTDQDRIHHGAGESVRAQLVSDWSRARAHGENAVMVASHLRAVDDLNRRARELRREAGDLGLDRVSLGGRPYTEGDEVLALRNDYEVGILNGTRGTVVRVDQRKGALHVVTDDQRWLAVRFDYAITNLTHGYAMTIHKAQGATVDRCFVLVDDTMSREHTYTAMSRGRHGNDLYIADDDPRADVRHGPEIDGDRVDRLRSSVARTVGQQLARDQAPDLPDGHDLIHEAAQGLDLGAEIEMW
jgi:conjugative relaxase-like TrwC/TraI family protein